MWSLRNIYFYIVCLITIIIIIVGLISTINSITDLAFPTDYYDSMTYYDKYAEETGLTKEEYMKQREKEIETQRKNDISRRKKNIVNNLAMVFVALPFYAYHWKKIQNEHPVKNA